MNSVVLIGRLTRDPELRYTAGNTAVCNFTLAIDRLAKPGEKKQADFPRVIAFGKQAENCDRFLSKGRLAGVHGRIQTGSYTNKDGATVYTTDIVAERVEFLEFKEKDGAATNNKATRQPEPTPEGFSALDEDIPF